MNLDAIAPVLPAVPEQMLTDDAEGLPRRTADHGKHRDHPKREPPPTRHPPAPGTGLDLDEFA